MCIMFYTLWYIYNIHIHTHTQALINEVRGDGMHLYEMTVDQLAAKARACFDKFDSDHSGVCVCV